MSPSSSPHALQPDFHMEKITTHLWFDKEAKEAAALYIAAFGGADSRVTGTTKIENTPSGGVDIVNIELFGEGFTLINAGPMFRFNPSISFHVACYTREEVDAIWEILSPGATILMALGEYPFSERYGWLKDRYGLSWQLSYVENEVEQRITPVLMFTDNVYGKAEEAVHFYISVFRDSAIHSLLGYGKGEEPEKEGTVKYASFKLEGKEFGALDSAREHGMQFNEAISFVVRCDSQEEIDYYWEKLSAVVEAEQCGWLKDKYGLSWQVTPRVMDEMMSQGDPDQITRVTEAFLKMTKFDIKKLEEAYSATPRAEL
jgi:predicted 3-demethylubiquinone-9 3-methyltransferase (glyoxalase superfamily)